MAPTVEAVSLQLGLGEGPHWTGRTGSLYLVDIPGCAVHRYHPESGKTYSLKLDVPNIGFITPVAGTTDRFVVGVGCDLKVLQWDGTSGSPGSLELLHSLPGELGTNRINDGKADPTGRLFFGTMTAVNENIFKCRDGSFYSYNSSEKLKKHLTGIGISNGLAWDEAKGAMYYIDSLEQTVDALDWDKSGCKGNRRVVFDLKKNKLTCFPDGMTIDSDGRLWVACYSGGRVLHVDPETGKLLQEVAIPTKNVTSVAWGGPDLSDLYVTTGSDEGDPKGGSTFRVRGLGSKGLPMEEFRL